MKLRQGWNWGPLGRKSADLPDTQIWKIVTDDTTAANLLLTGGLDLGTFFGGPDVDRLVASTSLTHTAIPIFFTQNLVFAQDAGKLGGRPGVPRGADADDRLEVLEPGVAERARQGR